MVHVCFVSPKIHNFLDGTDPSGAGGAERQQYLLGAALLERGHRVSLVTRNYDDGARYEESDGFAVWKTVPDVRGVLNAPPKALRVLDTLRRVDADVFYVRGNDFLTMVTGAYCRVTAARFVYSVSSDANVEPDALDSVHPIHRRAFVGAIRDADGVVAQTEYQRSVLDDSHGIDSTVIPNGYEMPPMEAVLPHDEREYVLWVGRMARDQKRPERYLELAHALPDVEFVMVGPPNDDEEAYFEELRERAGEIGNLRFVGFVPPNEVDGYYRRASMLVNTSETEGFPNTFLEAWRYATPVVSLTYDLDGKLADGTLGRHSGSMDALVDDVARITAAASERSEIGWRAREYVHDHYSMDAFVDEYEAFLERVASR
jgi:glycosyltransferase involved in cell wall biosynthesis